MRFLNSVRLLFENFKDVYKLLIYKIIIALIGITLCTAFVLPELTTIFRSVEVQVLIEDCRELAMVVLSMQGDGLPAVKEAILGENGSLTAAILIVESQTPRIILTLIGCVFVCLIARFVETLGYYTIGVVLDDKMKSYAETPFFSAFIANLAKSSAYSIVYVSVAFAFDLVIVLVSYSSFNSFFNLL